MFLMPLSEKEAQLLSYVKQYMQHAEACCAVLRAASGLDFTRVSRFERLAVLPQKGKVQGLTYAFHGIGCFFKRKGLIIDVDFDMTGGCNAVDELRIWLFVQDNYPKETYWTQQSIADSMSQLVQQRLLHQVAREHDEHFYYLGAAPDSENRS